MLSFASVSLSKLTIKPMAAMLVLMILMALLVIAKYQAVSFIDVETIMLLGMMSIVMILRIYGSFFL